MKKDKFKDKFFEIMNETESLAIADIESNDHGDRMNITLWDSFVELILSGNLLSRT